MKRPLKYQIISLLEVLWLRMVNERHVRKAGQLVEKPYNNLIQHPMLIFLQAQWHTPDSCATVPTV